MPNLYFMIKIRIVFDRILEIKEANAAPTIPNVGMNIKLNNIIKIKVN